MSEPGRNSPDVLFDCCWFASSPDLFRCHPSAGLTDSLLSADTFSSPVRPISPCVGNVHWNDFFLAPLDGATDAKLKGGSATPSCTVQRFDDKHGTALLNCYSDVKLDVWQGCHKWNSGAQFQLAPIVSSSFAVLTEKISCNKRQARELPVYDTSSALTTCEWTSHSVVYGDESQPAVSKICDNIEECSETVIGHFPARTFFQNTVGGHDNISERYVVSFDGEITSNKSRGVMSTPHYDRLECSSSNSVNCQFAVEQARRKLHFGTGRSLQEGDRSCRSQVYSRGCRGRKNSLTTDKYMTRKRTDEWCRANISRDLLGKPFMKSLFFTAVLSGYRDRTDGCSVLRRTGPAARGTDAALWRTILQGTSSLLAHVDPVLGSRAVKLKCDFIKLGPDGVAAGSCVSEKHPYLFISDILNAYRTNAPFWLYDPSCDCKMKLIVKVANVFLSIDEEVNKMYQQLEVTEKDNKESAYSVLTLYDDYDDKGIGSEVIGFAARARIYDRFGLCPYSMVSPDLVINTRRLNGESSALRKHEKKLFPPPSSSQKSQKPQKRARLVALSDETEKRKRRLGSRASFFGADSSKDTLGQENSARLVSTAGSTISGTSKCRNARKLHHLRQSIFLNGGTSCTNDRIDNSKSTNIEGFGRLEIHNGTVETVHQQRKLYEEQLPKKLSASASSSLLQQQRRESVLLTAVATDVETVAPYRDLRPVPVKLPLPHVHLSILCEPTDGPQVTPFESPILPALTVYCDPGQSNCTLFSVHTFAAATCRKTGNDQTRTIAGDWDSNIVIKNVLRSSLCFPSSDSNIESPVAPCASDLSFDDASNINVRTINWSSICDNTITDSVLRQRDSQLEPTIQRENCTVHSPSSPCNVDNVQLIKNIAPKNIPSENCKKNNATDLPATVDCNEKVSSTFMPANYQVISIIKGASGRPMDVSVRDVQLSLMSLYLKQNHISGSVSPFLRDDTWSQGSEHVHVRSVQRTRSGSLSKRDTTELEGLIKSEDKTALYIQNLFVPPEQCCSFNQETQNLWLEPTATHCEQSVPSQEESVSKQKSTAPRKHIFSANQLSHATYLKMSTSAFPSNRLITDPITGVSVPAQGARPEAGVTPCTTTARCTILAAAGVTPHKAALFRPSSKKLRCARRLNDQFQHMSVCHPSNMDTRPVSSSW